MQLDAAVTSLDPAKGSAFQDSVTSWTMYDPIINMDNDGEIIAGLAESWESTASGATFTIRTGVTCSDGTKVTPKVVADSFTRYFDPKTAAPFVSSVIGAGNQAQVTSDDTSVSIQLDEPFSGLLAGLTTPYTGVVCPAGLKNPESLRTESSGTGPYILTSQKEGDSYSFKARDGYDWGPEYKEAQTDGTMPAELTLKVVTDESTRANLQGTSELQVSGYTGDAWKRFESDDAYSTATSAQSDTMLVFNETEARPTADPAVRKAIIQTIDRDRLNDVQSFGAGEVVDNLGQTTYACYDDSLGGLLPAQDMDAASKVLKGKSIRVIGTNLLAGGAAQSYILSQLEAVGANVELSNMNNEAWISELFTPTNNWDVTILVFGNMPSNLLSSGNFFAGEQPASGQNLGGVSNPKAEKALAEARTKTGDAGCSALSRFQSALFERFDTLPLATSPSTVVFSEGITGVVSKGFTRAGTLRVGG